MGQCLIAADELGRVKQILLEGVSHKVRLWPTLVSWSDPTFVTLPPFPKFSGQKMSEQTPEQDGERVEPISSLDLSDAEHGSMPDSVPQL